MPASHNTRRAGKGCINDGLRRFFRPYLETPGLFRPQVDCAAAGTVDVDFEPRAMDDDPVAEVADQELGEGVLLPQAFFFGNREHAPYRGARGMAVVNGGRDDGCIATVLGPPGGCGGWRQIRQ